MLGPPAIDLQRIRTTIPIHEVSHDAPIIHQSQTHNAVPIEHFLQKGGILHNAIPPNDIGSRVLHSGQCTREIDGVADNLAKELKLAESHVRISPLEFNHSASDKKTFSPTSASRELLRTNYLVIMMIGLLLTSVLRRSRLVFRILQQMSLLECPLTKRTFGLNSFILDTR